MFLFLMAEDPYHMIRLIRQWENPLEMKRDWRQGLNRVLITTLRKGFKEQRCGLKEGGLLVGSHALVS